MSEIAFPKFADGLFGTILIDPPWLFQNRMGKVAPEHRRLHCHQTLTFDEIAALPVGKLAAPLHARLYVRAKDEPRLPPRDTSELARPFFLLLLPPR
jgi:hypothetical protein